MASRESYSGVLARVAQRATFVRQLPPAGGPVRPAPRAPRPASWPPPLAAHEIPVPPPGMPPRSAFPAPLDSPPTSTVRPTQLARWGPPVTTAPFAATPLSSRDVETDDNPFTRRSRRARRRFAFALFLLCSGGIAFASLEPQLLPAPVARFVCPLGRWARSRALPPLAHAREWVLARVAPIPQGRALAPPVASPFVAPNPPPAALVIPPCLPPAAAASSPPSAPPVVDVSALPVARTADPVVPAVRTFAPPAPPRPAPVHASGPSLPPPRSKPAPEQEAPKVAMAVRPPPARAAPAPAPGSLDDLIRKAVEADAKKK